MSFDNRISLIVCKRGSAKIILEAAFDGGLKITTGYQFENTGYLCFSFKYLTSASRQDGSVIPKALAFVFFKTE